MVKGSPATPLVEIGSYTCPNTHKLIPLLGDRHDVQWPVIVKECQSCHETHVVKREDVSRPPLFGYE